jgi:hypothetical protein
MLVSYKKESEKYCPEHQYINVSDAPFHGEAQQFIEPDEHFAERSER